MNLQLDVAPFASLKGNALSLIHLFMPVQATTCPRRRAMAAFQGLLGLRSRLGVRMSLKSGAEGDQASLLLGQPMTEVLDLAAFGDQTQMATPQLLSEASEFVLELLFG
jgi:hypothetical protein